MAFVLFLFINCVISNKKSIMLFLQYYTKTGMPTKNLSDGVCAVCGQALVLPFDENDTTVERVYKLSCYHTFHDHCIRGWCIVGKS